MVVVEVGFLSATVVELDEVVGGRLSWNCGTGAEVGVDSDSVPDSGSDSGRVARHAASRSRAVIRERRLRGLGG